MRNLILKMALLGAAFTLTNGAFASPFGTYDPRSLALGGVGVTMATARNANFFNPAMLAATRDDDDFALGVPVVAARAAAPEDLLDDIDDLEATGDALSNALSLFRAVPSQGNAASAATALANFNTSLGRVNNKVLDADLFGGAILSVPSKKFGVGVHVGGRVNFGARFTYAGADQTLISNLSSDLGQCATDPIANAANCTSAQNAVAANGDITGLQSNVAVRGLLVRELGVAGARRFESLGDLDLGLTLKAQKVRSFDYVVTAQNSEIDFEKGQKDDSTVNVDIGVAKNFGSEYKVGAVVKNLFKRDFTTVLGNTVQMKPQVRIGASHHRGWGNFGVDLDLTKNKPVAAGFDQESQLLGVGAEFDLLETLQLRLGYRHDLAGNYDGLPSIGLGFSPFGIHIDFAVAKADGEVAAGAQLGFNF